MYRKFDFKKVNPNVRYYFTSTGDMKANVRDRLTHKHIAYLNSYDEINHFMDKMDGMSQDEYYQYIFSLGIKPQDSKENEEWFTGAWIYETDKMLIQLDREIPKTTLTAITLEIEYTKYKSLNRGSWGDATKSTRGERMEKTSKPKEEETKATREESKATRKKLLRKSIRTNKEETKNTVEAPKMTQEKPKEVKATTMQEELDNLTQLKASSKITFGEYVKMKRQIIEKYGA